MGVGTMSLPQTHAYWMADALGMRLFVSKTNTRGGAKVKVPTFDPLRLVCPVSIKKFMHRDKVGQSAVLVQIRGHLHIVLGYDGTHGHLWMVDSGRLPKLATVFKGVRNLEQVGKRLEGGIAARYLYSEREKKWKSCVVKDLGEQPE